MAGAAVAAFVPAELCPDHFMAAGKLTQAELPARDLGHGRLLLAACPSPQCHTPGSFLVRWPSCPARSAGVGLVMLAARHAAQRVCCRRRPGDMGCRVIGDTL